jgi:DNA-binding GntR family transcriptional regulator
MVEEEQKVTIVEFRELPIKDIEGLIKAYVEEHGDFWPDEFANDHKLSIMDVFSAIDNLVEEGYLENKKGDRVPRRGSSKNKG